MAIFSLSVDAGGVRSVEAAATVLGEMTRVTGATPDKVFNLVGGSSGGSIAAAMVSFGYPPREMRDLAQDVGSRVFRRPFWHRVKTLNGLVGPKYDNRPLLREATDIFYGLPMARLTIPTIIATTDLVNWESVFIKSHQGAFQSWPIAHAVVASSAAPFYFPPFQGRFGDGGYHTYNPVLAVLAEGHLLFGREEEIHVLSVASGQPPRGKPSARNPIKVARSIGGAVTNSQAKSQTWLARQFTRDTNDHIYRIQVPYESDMDDTSPETLKGLRTAVIMELSQSEEWGRFLDAVRVHR